jgi:outer membrane protein OmpA-like peptidoglycan-associated protein
MGLSFFNGFSSHAATLATTTVNIHTMTFSSSHRYMNSEDALMEKRGAYSLGVMFDFVDDPLVELSADRKTRIKAVVDGLYTLELSGGFKIGNRLQFVANMPLHYAKLDQDKYRTAKGDLRTMLKFRLNGDSTDKTMIALILDNRFKTGEAKYFLTDSSFGIGGRFVIEHDFGGFAMAGNLGYLKTSQAFYQTNSDELDYRSRIVSSLSVYLPIGKGWALNGDYQGAIPLPVNQFQSPGEFYLGAQWRPSASTTLLAGFSTGGLKDVGSNNARVIAGLRSSFGSVEEDAAPKIEPVMETKILEPVAPIQAVVEKPVVPAIDPALQEVKTIQLTKNEIKTPPVHFIFGSGELTESAKKILDRVAEMITKHSDQIQSISIEGHTDQHGSDASNDRLSLARVKSVKRYLVKKGVPAGQLAVKGYGKRHPRITTASGLPETRVDALNRRVEFKVNSN